MEDDNEQRIKELLYPITRNIEWMSPESAEMTKHALNAFLAMSIAFINEIAEVCGEVGADPCEVERGLKSEERIGPKAYLRPDGPYTGRTLARDLEYLTAIKRTPLISSIQVSNNEHKQRGKE